MTRHLWYIQSPSPLAASRGANQTAHAAPNSRTPGFQRLHQRRLKSFSSPAASSTLTAAPAPYNNAPIRLRWVALASTCMFAIINAWPHVAQYTDQLSNSLPAPRQVMASLQDSLQTSATPTSQADKSHEKTPGKADEPKKVVAKAPKAPEITYPVKLALNVHNGDTLLAMLMRNHVPAQDAHNVVEALRPAYNPSQLRAGQSIHIELDSHRTKRSQAQVEELAIRLPNLTRVELARLQDGSFNVEKIQEKLITKTTYQKGTVRTSLFQAAADAGIPRNVMNELVKAFSYDVDFQRDIKPNNTLEVIYDKQVTKDGRTASNGKNPSYAKLTLGKKVIEIYKYTSQGQTQWFASNGQSIVKALLRTPVNGARISSGFGMRRHPILGYSKMHRGVDFAASTGTPIYAAGNGVITFRGWKNGYGNYMQIRHNGTTSTAYGHISRFATGLANGSPVKQGQIIAYVGATGRATGPHLHYEVLQHGLQVNPTAQQFNTGQTLAGRDLVGFKNLMAQAKKTIAEQSLASR